jgi:hypothetical protein
VASSSVRLESEASKGDDEAVKEMEKENRCATPRRLAGRLLVSLTDDEFEPVFQHHRSTATATTATTSTTTKFGVWIVRSPSVGAEIDALSITTSARPRLPDANGFNWPVGKELSDVDGGSVGSDSRSRLSVAVGGRRRPPTYIAITGDDRRRFIERGSWDRWNVDDEYETDEEPEKRMKNANGRRSDLEAATNMNDVDQPATVSAIVENIGPFHRSSSAPMYVDDGDWSLRSVTRRSTQGRAAGALPISDGDGPLSIGQGDDTGSTTCSRKEKPTCSDSSGCTAIVAGEVGQRK